jgi:hypothetical protein
VKDHEETWIAGARAAVPDQAGRHPLVQAHGGDVETARGRGAGVIEVDLGGPVHDERSSIYFARTSIPFEKDID